MDENAVFKLLVELHREIEVDAGEDPAAVKPDIFPLDGLKGFDSILIPNVVRGLTKGAGITLKKGERLRNPYIDGSKTRLTLRNVAKRFCDLYKVKKP
jgi:hypothetical protein